MIQELTMLEKWNALTTDSAIAKRISKLIGYENRGLIRYTRHNAPNSLALNRKTRRMFTKALRDIDFGTEKAPKGRAG